MGENKYIIYEWVIIISLEHRQWHSLLEWSAEMHCWVECCNASSSSGKRIKRFTWIDFSTKRRRSILSSRNKIRKRRKWGHCTGKFCYNYPNLGDKDFVKYCGRGSTFKVDITIDNIDHPTLKSLCLALCLSGDKK